MSPMMFKERQKEAGKGKLAATMVLTLPQHNTPCAVPESSES